jgi:hypothetical protein
LLTFSDDLISSVSLKVRDNNKFTQVSRVNLCAAAVVKVLTSIHKSAKMSG